MKLSNETLYQVYLIKHEQKQNKGHRSPDSERSKTYKAEWRFQEKWGSGLEFDRIQEVQWYVDRITKSKTYQKLVEDGWSIEQLFTGNKVTVAAKTRNTGRGSAGLASPGHITLDTYAGMNEYTVLHELAHCVGHWHHGRSFRKTLLRLVSTFMGRAKADLLIEEFKASKLSYGDARKPLSFEHWVESKERTEKMRERRSI